jgi:hypothetical protein
MASLICVIIAGSLPARHIETFNTNTYFKGVSIPEPESNVSTAIPPKLLRLG